MSSSSSNTINPLIDRILSNPLSFSPAKQSDKENDNNKPSSYIVLSKASLKSTNAKESIPFSSTSSSSQISNKPSKETQKPKSLAEALAAYTGTKTLTKAEKKQLRKDKKSMKASINTDEDLGKELGEEQNEELAIESENNDDETKDIQLESDSNYESASEYHSNTNPEIISRNSSTDSLPDLNVDSTSKNASTESLPFAEFKSELSISLSSSGVEDHGNEEDEDEDDDEEDDEDDEDFDEKNMNDEAEAEDESFDEDEEKGVSNSDIDEDDDLSRLKDDLMKDAFKANEDEKIVQDEEDEVDNEEDNIIEAAEKQQLSSKTSLINSTPPTSPEDEEKQIQVEQSTTQDQNKSKIELESQVQSKSGNVYNFEKSKSPSLTNFYKINENPEDRGSNNSKRILKNWTKIHLNKKPSGLLNHGVTCYMNSAIQALIHIPAIQHYLNDIYKGKYNKSLSPRSVSGVLAELSQRMWGINGNEQTVNPNGNNKKRTNQSSTPKYINPKKIIQRLDDINCMMSEWQQEDSHEYFMSLISRLQEDSTPKGVKLNESIIYDIFGGLLNQSVTCQNCGYISETKQEFYDLSLGLNRKRKLNKDQNINDNITNSSESNNVKDNNDSTINNSKINENNELEKNRYTIEKSIKEFFSTETIKIDKRDKKSGYYCEKCSNHSIATKKSTIDRSPETLIVHLKRFKFNGNSSSKLKQSISYEKYLDLSEYSSIGSSLKYQLISVIVHEGRSISSGHYIAHCLQPDGTWSTYDDEYINKINEREALSDPSAYFLIYTKLSPKNSGIKEVRDHDEDESEQPLKKKSKTNKKQ